MNKKKPYRKPEVKSAELSFTTAQMATCHTPSVTWPQETFPPASCEMSGCKDP
jgi:hypothetical protein